MSRKNKLGLVSGLWIALLGPAYPVIAAPPAPEAVAAWDRAAHAIRNHAAIPIKNESGEANSRGSGLSVDGEMMTVPSGLLHHWTGAVLIPDSSLMDVRRVLQDYNSYTELYKPAVIQSGLVSRNGDEFHYKLKFVQREFGIKVGLDGEFVTSYFAVDPTRGYSITEAKELIELDNPGTEDEHPIRPKASHGYVQRVYTVVRYQEVGNGVLLQVESLTLSRGVPGPVRWLIAPAIQKFSRQTMTVTLQRLREKVEATQSFVSAANR